MIDRLLNSQLHQIACRSSENYPYQLRGSQLKGSTLANRHDDEADKLVTQGDYLAACRAKDKARSERRLDQIARFAMKPYTN